MARRVSIGAGASSPFVVSAAGYDAIGANFQRIIFSADQTPFRLMATGIIAGIAPPELGQGLNQKQDPFQYNFDGRYPVVLVATQNEAYLGSGGEPIAAGPISPPYIAVNNTESSGINYYQSGAGLVVLNDGRVFGLNGNEKFQIATPYGPKLIDRPPVRIYYAIMRNLG